MRTAVGLVFAFSALSYAQSVISAHSGVVQYVEGDASIDRQPIQSKFAQFPEVKPDQVIATGEGRVELLLTPGVFLRLAENSSARMVSNSLADTRLAVLSGSALIEVGELLQGNTIAFEAAGTQIALPRPGLYRIDSEPARVRVYEGQVRVGKGSAQVVARKGHEIALDADVLTASSFDLKDTDAFYRWSARRTEYVAAANVTSARVAANSGPGGDPGGYGSGYFGSGYGGYGAPYGGWAWNPWFGMFTYMPAYGAYYSPFGSYFYSPGVASTLVIPRSGGALSPALAARTRPAAFSPAMARGAGGMRASALGGGRASAGVGGGHASAGVGGGHASASVGGGHGGR